MVSFISVGKTKFFVINNTEVDAGTLHVNGLTISHGAVYVCLGSAFTSNGPVSSALRAHAKMKMSRIMTFVSSIKRNNDVPYIVKQRVFDAALMSTLLYG